jgi:hypothetical protein
MKFFCIYILIIIGFSSCNNQQREKELNAREDSLNRKEQDLMLREKQVQLREQKLVQIEQDTVNASADTLSPELLGKWSVKMTCTETTCPGSAVGDSKTEEWELTADAGKVVAKAMDGNTPVRIYSGLFNGNTIELVHIRPAQGSQPEIKMTVRLRVMNGSLADGQREIQRENECKVIYALQLEKV